MIFALERAVCDALCRGVHVCVSNRARDYYLLTYIPTITSLSNIIVLSFPYKYMHRIEWILNTLKCVFDGYY